MSETHQVIVEHTILLPSTAAREATHEDAPRTPSVEKHDRILQIRPSGARKASSYTHGSTDVQSIAATAPETADITPDARPEARPRAASFDLRPGLATPVVPELPTE